MTPIQRYQQDIALGGILRDPVQANVIQALQKVYDGLVAAEKSDRSAIGKLAYKLRLKHRIPVRGLYLWGGVGIGKTYLMDTFFNSLPFRGKLRMHFHRFMREIQQQLTILQGEKDPLQKIADRIAQRTRVICFDEFFVDDIGDAIILGNLFTALFQRGVSLVATSNIPPDELYKNGLQRALFLPAIAAIKNNTDVIQLQIDRDYRLRNLQEAGVFFCPIDITTKSKMRDMFESFARGAGQSDGEITIANRPVKIIREAHTVIWFDFPDICTVPRSHYDYLEIARQYPAVLISNVPKITPEQENTVTYLIHLVDVFYDANVKLIVSAQVPIEEIYSAGRYLFEFNRTTSRLQEMQTFEYLKLPHKTV